MADLAARACPGEARGAGGCVFEVAGPAIFSGPATKKYPDRCRRHPFERCLNVEVTWGKG
jgi:hypothetical protein